MFKIVSWLLRAKVLRNFATTVYINIFFLLFFSYVGRLCVSGLHFSSPRLFCVGWLSHFSLSNWSYCSGHLQVEFSLAAQVAVIRGVKSRVAAPVATITVVNPKGLIFGHGHQMCQLQWSLQWVESLVTGTSCATPTSSNSTHTFYGR